MEPTNKPNIFAILLVGVIVGLVLGIAGYKLYVHYGTQVESQLIERSKPR